MAREYVNIARVEKTVGSKGEVVCVPVRGLPDLLRPGLRVCLTPPALKRERWSTVGRVIPEGAGTRCALSCASGIDEAEGLVGCYLLARRADLDLDGLAAPADELIGRAVEDARLGALGRIEEVMTGPANDVWVVRGPRGEVLIPAVPQIVTDVPEEGPVSCSVPRGLVEGDDPC